MRTRADTPTDYTNLGYYLSAFLRYRKRILAIHIVVLLVVGLYIAKATPVYRSRAVLMVEPVQLEIGNLAQKLYARIKTDEFYETQFQLLRSRNLAFSVVNDLGLWDSEELQPDSSFADESEAEKREEILDRFVQRLRVRSILSTRLITVQYDSTDPALAAKVVNTLSEHYLQRNHLSRQQAAEIRRQGLEQAVHNLEDSLQTSEAELQDFRALYPELVEIGSELSVAEQALLSGLPAVADVQSELDRLDSSVQAAEAALDSGQPDALPDFYARDPIWLALQAQLNERQLAIGRMRATLGENHPRRRALQSEIDSLQRSLDELASAHLAELQRQRSLTQSQLRRLLQEQKASRSSLQDLETARLTMRFLESRRDQQDTLHRSLFKALQAARITDDIVASEATLVERSGIPVLPYRPRPLILTGLALISTLIFTFVATGMITRLDRRVRSRQDLAPLNLQPLGDIPRTVASRPGVTLPGWLPDRRQQIPLVPQTDAPEWNPVREAVDSLRLMLADSGQPQQVIMLTSSVPAEGKSSTSIALAAACQRAGERVLLIDCDLRRPGIDHAAGITRTADGLSTLLAGSGSLAHCIHSNLMGLGIDFLGAGPATSAPGQLLTSARLAELLGNLRRHYQRIIVDTPPVLPVSDALPLSRLCDCVVYVVHSHRTPLACVECGISRLRHARAPLAGYVLSQVPVAALNQGQPRQSLIRRFGSWLQRPFRRSRPDPTTPTELNNLAYRLREDIAIQQLEESLDALPDDLADRASPAVPVTVSTGTEPGLYFGLDMDLGGTQADIDQPGDDRPGRAGQRRVGAGGSDRTMPRNAPSADRRHPGTGRSRQTLRDVA